MVWLPVNSLDNDSRRIVIAGGGFFGCSIALMLRRRGWQPVIVEDSSDLLTRASRVNQARVHGGYHYPRSLMTAWTNARSSTSHCASSHGNAPRHPGSFPPVRPISSP